MFTVRIKPNTECVGVYVARNLLYTEISLTKDLHSARIWGTYQQAEQWLFRYRKMEILNNAEVVEVLDILRKAYQFEKGDRYCQL